MSGITLLRTPLHAWHQAQGARLVDFAGWSMPVQYTSIVEEHQAVRQAVGLFDISHMGRLSFDGPGVREWLERLTTNHVARLAEGQIQYSLLTDESGGVLDDILVMHGPSGDSVVCNASNRAKVVAHLQAHRPDAGATLADRTLETAMIAIQGPRALEVLQAQADVSLAPLAYYTGTTGRVAGTEALISRTGYTGEDGFELIVEAPQAEAVWSALLETGKAHGIRPCGLGARDTLRFEAGMPLYGHELSEEINPYEAGLGWVVKLGKGAFLGREALRQIKGQPARRRVGLALDGKRIARQGYAVSSQGRPVGQVTSGTFAPTLGRSLAMALVEPAAAVVGTRLEIDVRGQAEPAEVVPLPFYRRERPAAAADGGA